MKPGATLGLSHGFLLGVMTNDAVDFRKDINVVLVAPKVRCSVVLVCCWRLSACTHDAAGLQMVHVVTSLMSHWLDGAPAATQCSVVQMYKATQDYP